MKFSPSLQSPQRLGFYVEIGLLAPSGRGSLSSSLALSLALSLAEATCGAAPL